MKQIKRITAIIPRILCYDKNVTKMRPRFIFTCCIDIMIMYVVRRTNTYYE